MRCFHSAIVEAMNGDGCCPPGASANADSDCAPKCGNRTVEGDEQCDDGNATSGDGCDGCRSESDGAICLMQQVRDDDCARCTCAKCEREALACYAPADTMERQLCRELVECGITEKCGTPDCYCGTMSLFACFSGAGNGPCKTETERAAMTTSLLEIEQRAADLNYPLGLGNALFTCIGRNCAEECDSGID